MNEFEKIRINLKEGKYTNKQPFPPMNLLSAERSIMIGKYNNEDTRIYNTFQLDIKTIIKELGFNERQAQLIFDKAWQDGHSSGYEEVLTYVEEYIDFILDIQSNKN